MFERCTCCSSSRLTNGSLLSKIKMSVNTVTLVVVSSTAVRCVDFWMMSERKRGHQQHHKQQQQLTRLVLPHFISHSFKFNDIVSTAAAAGQQKRELATTMAVGRSVEINTVLINELTREKQQ